MSMARVLAKGQIVIPKELRDKIHLSKGDRVSVELTDAGIVIVPIRKTYTQDFRGIVKGKLSLAELEDLYAEKS